MMRRWARWLVDDVPILGLSDATTRRLHWFAVAWSIVAIALLYLSGRYDWLDTRPGRTSFPITIQPIFIALFLVGVVVAWKWEIVGGTIAAFTAAGLAVFASQQLEAPAAVAVVLALAVPGVVWIMIDLHDFRPLVATGAILLIVVALAAGAFIADDAYTDLFGPTHPESATPSADLPVEWSWTGGVTAERAVVVARMPGANEPVLELRNEATSEPVAIVRGQPGFDDTVRFSIDGLRPDTRYRYSIGDREHGAAPVGEFRTFPLGPSSFTFAVASCARTDSNGAVFDAIAEVDPLLYIVTGDIHYANIDNGDRGEMADVLDLTLSRPAPSALYRSTAIGYVWDDHDFGGNGSDRTSESRESALSVYRSHVPHYELTSEDGAIHQAFTVGRVRIILTDGRSDRSPAIDADNANKTMLGSAQKAWLLDELDSASDDHALVVWVNPVPWIIEAEPGADHWGGYTTERAEIANHIAENDIDNLLMLSGDAHMLAIDDGSNNHFASTEGAAFPVFHAAALDRPGSTKGGPYSEGSVAGSGQFGTVTVRDDGGASIEIELVGRNWSGDVVIARTLTIDTESAALTR